MEDFKYETHMHCSESSGCAQNTGAEMAEFYSRRGYAGVIVTDHIIPSLRAAESSEAWLAYTKRAVAGYKACKARGDELGLDVYYAWEYTTHTAHFLIYGLKPEWHSDKPESMSWDIRKYLEQARSDGAYVVHAHPFREGSEPIYLYPSLTHGSEVLNGARIDSANRRALEYAESYGLKHVAGSDCHSVKAPRLCGVKSKAKLQSIEDFVSLISSGAKLFDDKLQA